ncbi:C-type lectin domain 4 [Mactra antiquata]
MGIVGIKSIEMHEFKQLGCRANIDWTDSVKTRTRVSCSRLCAENTSCSVAHYQESESLCKIDDRPLEDIVEYADINGPVWNSYSKRLPVCEDGWILNGTSCYIVSTEILTWTMCESHCLGRSAYLATIRSEEEMDFALSVLNNLPRNDTYLHIGGKFENGAWTWTNGEPWDYTRWHPLEPSGGDEICLGIFHLQALPAWGRYDWNDLLCWANGYCFCEKSSLWNDVLLTPSCRPVN